MLSTHNDFAQSVGRTDLVPTGFIDLDILIGGFAPATVTLITGEPGVGTTTLLHNFVRQSALSSARPTTLISLDHASTEGLAARIYAAHVGEILSRPVDEVVSGGLPMVVG